MSRARQDDGGRIGGGMRRALAGLAFCAFASSPGAPAAAGPCALPEAVGGAVPADWRPRDVAGAFAMPLPPDTVVEIEPGAGRVGQAIAETFTLDFDRSPWNGPFVRLPAFAQYDLREVTIDGRKAQIQRACAPTVAPARRYLLALRAPGLEVSEVGEVSLGLTVWQAGPENLAAIEAAMLAIRLP